MAKKRAIPKNVAQAADLYFQVREERLAAQKALEPLAQFESQLREHLINTIPKSQATGVSGKLVQVQVVTDTVPTIKDRKKFEAYVKKTGAFDLMTASLNTKAVRERWEQNKSVPGVDSFTVVKLSVHKLKGGK